MSRLLRIFRRPDYKSDVTQFIEELKTKKPDIEAQQRAGRAILWDKQIDPGLQDEWRQSRVRQSGYVYGGGPEPTRSPRQDS